MTHHTKTLLGVSTHESGGYGFLADHDPWGYRYDVEALGTRSERRGGRLTYSRGVVLGNADGDWIETPWGPMQWFGGGLYEHGWLLQRTYDKPIDVSGHKLPDKPDCSGGGGTWSSDVGVWAYDLRVLRYGSKSEQRNGTLRREGRLVEGSPGEEIKTPWGTMVYTKPLPAQPPLWGRYGWLLPEQGGVGLGERRLSSLYMAESPLGHVITLGLPNDTDEVAWDTTLTIDRNTCTLNDFGDRETCTKMAIMSHPVHVERLRREDPHGLGRMLFAISAAEGEALPKPLYLITQRGLRAPYVKVGASLVPLYPDEMVV